MLMTQHPAEELLAAFVDDRLDSSTREPVTEHLASCGECREIVLMSTAFQDEPVPVVPGNFGGRRWMPAIASLAAAAAIAFIVTPRLFGPRLDEFVAASDGMSRRISDGRFAGGFAHSERPARNRGDGDKNDIDSTKLTLYQLADKAQKAIWSGPHVRGLSEVLIAEKGDFGNAIPLLEKAHQKAHGAERDRAAIDLAAALLERAYWPAGSANDNQRALDLSNEVLTRQPKSPEALWNRAVALAALNRDDEALRAFDDYLKVDSNSKWADEARERKARIESFR
jgi:Putative zinc-finger